MLLQAKLICYLFACILPLLNQFVIATSDSPSTMRDSTRYHQKLNAESTNVDRVCIVGSGNWGSAIAKIVGENCEKLPQFHNEVNMWVYEEYVSLPNDDASDTGGSGVTSIKLSEVINTRHENIKYLPGIKLPTNVVAVADLAEACQDATLLIFVLPHQFLPKLLPTIRASAHPACRGVSLIKGIGEFRYHQNA